MRPNPPEVTTRPGSPLTWSRRIGSTTGTLRRVIAIAQNFAVHRKFAERWWLGRPTRRRLETTSENESLAYYHADTE